MNIFISSVIRGLELYRDAVARAARTFRHGVKRSEDFGASPDSPQRACLAGVREADVTVLILGDSVQEGLRTVAPDAGPPDKIYDYLQALADLARLRLG